MATTPPFDPQQPVQPPVGVPPAPPKKKMGALGWVLIGCGGLLVIILVCVLAAGLFVWHKASQAGLDPELMKKNPGLASVKMLVALNPDLEMTSVDDGRGIAHIYDKKKNKHYILSFEEARQGRMTLQEEGGESVTMSGSGSGSNGSFEMKSSEGTLKLGGNAQVNLPSWVPSYPNSQPQASMSSETDKGKTIVFAFKTPDPVEKVVNFYKDGLTSAGMTITNNAIFSSNGNNGGMVAAKDQDGKHDIVVTIGTEQGQTSVGVTFTEKP
jgi:hypothetical protein